jgi:hypothetical protein
MTKNHRRSAARVALMVAVALGAPGASRVQDSGSTDLRHVIRGRVVDPARLRPLDAVLMLGYESSGAFRSVPVSTVADGSFVTRPVAPGTRACSAVVTHLHPEVGGGHHMFSSTAWM